MAQGSFAIGARRIGPQEPVFIVAELSANHGQDFDRARALIDAARAAGADAVKLQTYTPDTITIDSRKPPFMVGQGTPWEGRNLYELYGEAYTPWEWHAPLKEQAESLGMCWFSTPFDSTAVDFLEGLGAPAHKIASFELVDLPLLTRVAQTGKPVILSTGMATLAEIDEAVDTLRVGGCRELALLRCSSAYPAPPEEMNLATLAHLADAFGVPVGLSDHTLGLAVPVAAVALGACVIEKHLTLSRSAPGPDSSFSLEPEEFEAMVEAVRVARRARGHVRYGAGEREAASRIFRRSIFVVEPLRAGQPFTESNLRAIRPGHGLHTRHLKDVLGRTAACDIEAGTPLQWSLVGSPPAAS